jgi:hypothetical protein
MFAGIPNTSNDPPPIYLYLPPQYSPSCPAQQPEVCLLSPSMMASEVLGEYNEPFSVHQSWVILGHTPQGQQTTSGTPQVVKESAVDEVQNPDVPGPAVLEQPASHHWGWPPKTPVDVPAATEVEFFVNILLPDWKTHVSVVVTDLLGSAR